MSWGELIWPVLEMAGALLSASDTRSPERRAFADLQDDGKQAFMAALLFVANHDGSVGRREFDEIRARLKALGVDDAGVHFELARGARDEAMGDAADRDEAAFARSLVRRVPGELLREFMIRIAIVIAHKGDFEQQREALEMLADGAGWESSKLDTLIAQVDRDLED